MFVSKDLLEELMSTESNVYRVQNLSALPASYHRFRLKGLARDQEDYFANLQHVVNRLSRSLRSPVTFEHEDEIPFLIVKEGSAEPALQQQVVGRTVYLEKAEGGITLDFGSLTERTKPIAMRFLQFSAQGCLWQRHGLWQPSSGKPFFEKPAQIVGRDLGLHAGFQLRAMALRDGGIGICVDAKHAYVSSVPLSPRMTRKDFSIHRLKHFVYHYGHQWYEVRLAEWNENDVMHELIPDGDRTLPLYEYIHEKSQKPLPKELVNLPKDCSVAAYFNGRNQRCTVPTALCYSILDTEGSAGRVHGRTVMPPGQRHGLIQRMVDAHLRTLKHDDKPITLSKFSERIQRRLFPVPDLRFGNGRVLSAKETKGATCISLRELGEARLKLLQDKNAGLFTTTPFGRQYLILPRSIIESWGDEFMKALRRVVNDLYPQEFPYDPQIIVYDDRTGSTWVEYGLAIKQAATDEGAKGGYAVVMVHDPSDRRKRQEDQLSAFVIQTLFETCDLRAAVMHTEKGNEFFVEAQSSPNDVTYVVAAGCRGKLESYLRGVALNKVLLTNEKWPFVLAEPLHADLAIGVDLKKRHVAFTVVGRGGQYIATHPGKCRFAEKILADEFAKMLSKCVKTYFNETGEYAQNIVIHRDGRMYEVEVQGAHTALAPLRDEGFAAPTAQLTCVEINKHSYTSFRIFQSFFDRIERRRGHSNPTVGQYYVSTNDDGYVCTTGFPFARAGTSNPLHIHKVEGPMPIEHCLEDVFRLSCLAWTRPEDCTRYPIHIKLNDRRLLEDAGQFDEDEVERQEQEIES